jgi:hypothetical protein
MRIETRRFGVARRLRQPSEAGLEFSSKIFSLPNFATQNQRSALFIARVCLSQRTALARESFVAIKKCLCRKAFSHA